jgi:chromosome segregation ATPase
MNDLTLTITDLKAKVEKLVNLHQQLKKDNEQLSSENGNLLKTIEGQKVTIETLETKNKELVNTSNEEQNKIITDTKSKINELVQEIDNCIVLLK